MRIAMCWIAPLVMLGCSEPPAQGDAHVDGDSDDDADESIAVYRDVGEAAEIPEPTIVPGGWGWSVAYGDLDGDEWTDAVFGADDGIVVVLDLLGETQVLPPAYPDDAVPAAMSTADFDADGSGDLVVCGASTRLDVFAGNGDGTFEAPVALLTRDPTDFVNLALTDVEVVDFDADGLLDVVASGDDLGIAAFLGDGALAFELSATVESPTNDARHQNVSIADLDGDGHLDVSSQVDLTGWREGDPHDSWIAVHLGDGEGGLGPELRSDLAGLVRPLASFGEPGDVDGDGEVDRLFYVEQKTDPRRRVDIARGNGDGTFAAMETLFETDLGWNMWPADVTGDAIVDLVAVDVDSVWVAPGLGGGEFGALRIARHPGSYSGGFSVMDVDGSGLSDLLLPVSMYTGFAD